MAFNRDRKNKQSFSSSRSGGGGGFRPRFTDRGDRGPVEMHKAICDNCGKECEVPFRPTSGKPIFCSNCFQSQKEGSFPRRFEGRNSDRAGNFEDRQMFEAVCDECGNSCKVPFQPSGDKPIYCSNCFGEKKGAGNKQSGESQVQFKEQFEALNQKIDKILLLLDIQPEKEVIAPPVEAKPAKKKSPKKE